MSDFRSLDERNREARKRQMTRMRRRLATYGDVALGMYHMGVWHPHDCPCYDCAYGEVREFRDNARRPLGTPWVSADNAEPRARGRFVK